MKYWLTLIALAAAAPRVLPAQAVKLDAVLDRPTADFVSRLIDSARTMHLPTDGLIGTALEGGTRHATSEQITTAVRSYFNGLVAARRALGESSTDAELAAGVGAIISGVTPAQLAALRGARSRRSLIVPLVVLSDLAARGVPIDTATRTLYVALTKGAQDDDLSALRRFVELDIQAGASPGAAAMLRLEGLPGVTVADVRSLWTMGRSQPSLRP